ncbi:hypothetical protein DVA67_024990 [Solirubrobacter sp. CPCC 204708]|uniref:PASTA domain-containing protein n=1 Tax=Solirubrobacter deserti TaxID=2282478 RepID=A0ABT4RPC8_9ACTN|nr:hypothetical protein [Solirubrobacter deserti]MBE2319257.1 hypothetical protein [Solirubrobacter deserti]MDA0140263.1 hypothetical protein [Solirubrobacter deserti]
MVRRRAAVALLASAALAAAACGPPQDTPESGRYQRWPCPPAADAVPADKTLDARALATETLDDAAEIARGYGCRVRVVSRDGMTLARDVAPPRVIDVGSVTAASSGSRTSGNPENEKSPPGGGLSGSRYDCGG